MKEKIFLKKFSFGEMGHFGPKNGTFSQLWICCNNALKFYVGESNNGLYQKFFAQDKWAILLPQMAHPYNSGSALRIFLTFCRMKEAN